MCITEDKLVEAYGNATPYERFLLIYKNYSVFPQLIDCYEAGLFKKIKDEVEYNRRAKCGDDLGVRVQTSFKWNPVEAEGNKNLMIREALEKCNFTGNILMETDTPEKHKRDILTIHMMREEYKVFERALMALPPSEFRINYRYLHDRCKLTLIAEDEDKAYQTICNVVSAAKKLIELRAVPYFREVILED